MGPLAHSAGALMAAAGLPLGLAGLALRPHWRIGLAERLGAGPAAAPGAVWVHGASMGEIQAATRLFDRLAVRGRRVVASTMTVTGRDLLQRLRPDVPCGLAPLDHPWSVERALERVDPSVIVFVETELWPCWILGAARRGVPMVVVSGRLSDRSFPRYRRARRLVRPLLAKLDAVGTVSAVDAERFIALGVRPERVVVTADLKLEPPRVPPRVSPELEAVLGDVTLLVAGSTHSGEEAAALDALAAAETRGFSPALALAPRHPQRFEAVARLVAASGRRLRRRSRLGEAPLRPGDVLLLDSVGELEALYGCAAVVFVGGSLAPRGGHNVLEPARAGRAVLVGPYLEKSRGAVDLLLSAGAAHRVDGPRALAAAVVEALSDPVGWKARGMRGAEVVAAHRGAAERAAELVEAAFGRARRTGP